MKIKFHIIKEFTKDKDQRNSGGIVFKADYLTPKQMMIITAPMISI